MMASSKLSTISSFILTLLAVTSAAFSPPSCVTSSHPNIASLRVSTPISTSSLFMNKKKKQRSRSINSKGFGSGEELLSPYTSGSATLIKPKTSSSFRYAGSIRPGMQTPKRIVPSEKISFPDYAFDGQPKNRPALFPWVIEVKKPDEIEKMRAAQTSHRRWLL